MQANADKNELVEKLETNSKEFSQEKQKLHDQQIETVWLKRFKELPWMSG